MKLLIVDDHAIFRRLIGDVLASISPEIYECSDGQQTLHAYELHRPDVVLMDVAMRNVNGITATASLVAAHPEARVVMVTNYDEVEVRDAARAAGACGYVVKDNLFELRRVLEHVTGLKTP